MGASSSTRRIIVEEDEKQGAFLVQVSDSVTKQIYGVKEPGGKVAKKSIEPIHKAVEDVPAGKPTLPIQAFPAVPLGSPETAASIAAAAASAPEPTEKAEEKPALADAAASAEPKAKKPETVAPEATAVAAAAEELVAPSVKEPAAPSVEEPASPVAPVVEPAVPAAAAEEAAAAAAAVPAEEKPIEETAPAPAPDAAAAAAAAAPAVEAETSVDKAPLTAPKIPRSALLQFLSPSKPPPPPPEPKAPAAKEEAPAATEEAPAPAPAAPATASDNALNEERELLYKQMGEVYRERDKALKSIEDFYREKMNALQNQSTRMHSATRQEFNKAVEEVEKKFLKHVEAPVCEDLQLKVLECYRVNKAYPLNCSSEVQAFSSAVDQARQNVILAKKG